MGLQMILHAAASAETVTRPYRSRPFFARPTMSESLFDAPVHVVGVILADVQFGQGSGLSFSPFARFRAVRTVTVPVLARLAGSAAYPARDSFHLRVGQRLVYRVQNALVPANRPDVSAEILAGLKMGAKGAVRSGHHVRVCRFAKLAAEFALRRVPSAPAAVLSDHKSILRRIGSTTP